MWSTCKVLKEKQPFEFELCRPQVGYIVVIPLENEQDIGQFNPPADFEFQFRNNCTLYFKNTRTRDLDEVWIVLIIPFPQVICKVFGDLYAVIVDLENSIIRQLSQRVLNCEVLSSRLCIQVEIYNRFTQLVLCVFSLSFVMQWMCWLNWMRWYLWLHAQGTSTILAQFSLMTVWYISRRGVIHYR
jgi:hypothetical protein